MAKRPGRSEDTPEPPRPLLVRLGWLVAIWAASIAALALVALVLRGVMGLAGLSR